jgi:hypothetical protein
VQAQLLSFPETPVDVASVGQTKHPPADLLKNEPEAHFPRTGATGHPVAGQDSHV